MMQSTSRQKIRIITSLFGISNVNIVPTHKQEATQDCGLYSIAICVSLAFNLKPELMKFDQSTLRGHLLNCIVTENFLPFPAVTELLYVMSSKCVPVTCNYI